MPQPAYRSTDAHRRAVTTLASVGTPLTQIARALGVSVPTLRKHFAAELTHANAKRRGEVLLALWKSAMRGNVSAMVRLLKIMDRAGPEPLLKRSKHDNRR